MTDKATDVIASSGNSPSENYRNNQDTFAYRLSELVFGSLLASYILGFVGFAANIIAENGQTTPWRIFDPLFGTLDGTGVQEIYTLWIVFLYLFISMTFSMFTAAIYYNYHQSLLFLPADQRSSHLDFVLSLSIAVFFGISMIMPRFSLTLVGFALILVLLRRRKMISTFNKYVRGIVNGKLYQSVSGYNEDLVTSEVLVGIVEDEAQKSHDSTLRSWSSKSTAQEKWRLGFIILFLLGATFLFSFVGSLIDRVRFLEPTSDDGMQSLLWNLFLSLNYRSNYIAAALLVVLFVANLALFRSLKTSTQQVGVGNVKEFQDKINNLYDSFIHQVFKKAEVEFNKKYNPQKSVLTTGSDQND